MNSIRLLVYRELAVLTCACCLFLHTYFFLLTLLVFVYRIVSSFVIG